MLTRGWRRGHAELGDEPVDVVVRDAPAISEIGIAGVAPDSHTIFINLDRCIQSSTTRSTEIPRTIAHELLMSRDDEPAVAARLYGQR